MLEFKQELKKVIFQEGHNYNYELLREKIIKEKGYNYFRDLQNTIFKEEF